MRNTESENKAASRRQRSVEEADGILGEYAESGLTQRVFARENGISVSTLQFWLRRQKRFAMQSRRRKASEAGILPKVSLMEVELDDMGGRGDACTERYEVELPNGTRLRVPRGFRDEEVKRLLSVAKEVG